MRILGVDPGLRFCGLGVIDYDGRALRYVASHTIKPKTTAVMSERLKALHEQLTDFVRAYSPDCAALEETFVSRNGQSTLKLGQARGAIQLSLAMASLPIHEYAARLVKKTVTGVGAADKQQMQQMIRLLLPQSQAQTEDESDALAIAITHINHMRS